MQTYREILSKTDLFNRLDLSGIDTLLHSANRLTFQTGSIILREGEIGHELYIVLDGTVQVFTHTADGGELVLAKVGPGGYFGEQALLSGSTGRRNASVRAYSGVTLLSIAKEDFHRLLSIDHSLQDNLLRAGQEQVTRRLVRQSDLFRSLPADADVSAWSHELTLADNTVVFREGDPGEHFYYIIAGKVAIYQNDGDHPKLLAQLGEGQCFGELALLKREPRSARVVLGPFHL